jgi:hypothetical protein
MWNTAGIKRGVVIYADGMLYVYAEDGTIHLIKPNPNAFEPVSQFAASGGTGEPGPIRLLPTGGCMSATVTR